MSGVEQVPDWALERAKELHRAAGGATTPMAHAFARYIAAHEEAPVDPLLIEAREIVAVWLENNPNKAFRDKWTPENTRKGKLDDDATVAQALAALKRGIELAKTGGAA